MWAPTGTYSYKHHLAHSAKGSEWEEHKYIEEIDGKYYYPDSYADGRHISDLKGGSNRSERSEWSKDDKDFDEKNYDDKNRLGDTDFYGFKRDDGRSIVLMEDKKWVLPEGVELDSKLKKRLEKVSKQLEEKFDNGEKIDSDEWNKLVSDAIDDIKGDEKKKSKKGSSKKSGSSKKAGSSKSGSGKSEMTDRQRKARNKALIKKRTEEQQEAKRKRMARNKRVGKEYLNHSTIWAPTEVHIWR